MFELTLPKSAFFLVVLVTTAGLNGCAPLGKPVEVAGDVASVSPRTFTLEQKIERLEAQLAEQQKNCQAEKRRLAGALSETQRKLEETQKKLELLRSIERELGQRRSGPKE